MFASKAGKLPTRLNKWGYILVIGWGRGPPPPSGKLAELRQICF
jgi:hypothetical protein